MRYLKSFNEGKTPVTSEISDLSKYYLAYLLDDDYGCEVYSAYEWGMPKGEVESRSVVNITLTKNKDMFNDGSSGLPKNFLWDEIKDHFIAFIHLLSKEYDIVYVQFTTRYSQVIKKSLQEILDNDCDFEWLQKVTAVLSDKI
jgi:hypothetical protein